MLSGPPRLLVCLALGSLACCEGSGASTSLAELNAARARAGAEPVEIHPVLEGIATWRAEAVAASGSTSADVETLDKISLRLRRGGYQPHYWIESILVAGGELDLWNQLKQIRPEWYEDAVTGDFEHAGIGLAHDDGKTVASVILAVTQRTVELRQAAPLAELGRVRERVLAAVNAARADEGLRPVEADPLLDTAAQNHAEDMLRRAYYSHTSPEGESVMKRARKAGYRARSVSENIAKGLFTPEEVVERWLASPGHRRNILRRGAAETGAGVAFGDNAKGFEVIWVQVFAGAP